MNILNNLRFTLSQRVNQVMYNLKNISLEEAIGYIRNGNMVLKDYEFGSYTLQQAIEYIRCVDEKDLSYWKMRLLPAVTYNGTFTYIDKNRLDSYSCITALDFDHISDPNELAHLRNRLMKTPCVSCVFITPSGRDLKALVLHDNTDWRKHTDLYEQLLDKFNVASKDTGCKDLARRNYLSYDPDIWTNLTPVPYHYVPTAKQTIPVQQPQPKNNVQYGRTKSGKSIISIMNSIWKKNNPEYWQEGYRGCSIFKLACQLCKWGVDEDLALEYFVSGWESGTMDEKEITGHVSNAYKTEKNNFGTIDFKDYK